MIPIINTLIMSLVEVADFACRCRAKSPGSEACIDEIFKTSVFRDAPLADQLAHVDTLVHVEDIDVQPADINPDVLFIICVVRYDGADTPMNYGITATKDDSVHVLSNKLAQRVPLQPGERFVFGWVGRYAPFFEHGGFLDETLPPGGDTRSTCTLVAYLVPDSEYYALVCLQGTINTHKLSPFVLVPVPRKPDALTFTVHPASLSLEDPTRQDAIAEMMALSAAFRPYCLTDFTTGPFTVIKSRTAAYLKHRRIQEFRLTFFDHVATSLDLEKFRGCDRFDESAAAERLIAPSLEFAREVVHRKTLHFAQWETTKYVLTEWNYNHQHVFSIIRDGAHVSLRIRVFAPSFRSSLLVPYSMIDTANCTRYEMSRKLLSHKIHDDSDDVFLQKLTAQPRPLAAQPPGIRLALREYQLQSLGFMLDMESRAHTGGIKRTIWTPLCPTETGPQLWYSPIYGTLDWYVSDYDMPAGGILADPMGFGKTLEILALCAANPCVVQEPDVSRATLIMCPAALIGQWVAEIQRTTAFNVCAYHGTTKARTSLEQLATDFDIVLMTYPTYVTNQGALGNCQWHRVVMDEAHTMSDTVAQSPPRSRRRWCVSATPLKNLSRQLACLGFPTPMRNTARYNPRCLMTFYVLSGIMTRHSSNAMDTLPPLTEHAYPVDLTHPEQQLYTRARASSRAAVQAHRGRASIVLATRALQGMRNVAAGGEYTAQSLEQGAGETDDVTPDPSLVVPEEFCPVCYEPHETPSVTTCNHWFCRECIQTALHIRKTCPMCRHPQRVMQLRVGVRPDYVPVAMDGTDPVECRSKVDAVLSKLGTKTLVFGTNATALKYLMRRLGQAGVGFVTVNSGMTVAKRAACVRAFQENASIGVFVLSIRSASSGLHLAAADTVIFMDPSYNPEQTHQAIGRAWRHGQTRPVNVYHMYTRGTVEEHIFNHVTTTGSRPTVNALLSFL